ncbi:hypothetical protein LSTR_LSTR012840 [Laodelphax striatellus]|uniref:MADF domain-containing protein n=1 Tax=Laodelphax striatellus TaxID=195883 RepID=A0A482XDF2_LAOST|nr:hypothetical protein LSTR_LSTR012840 [Laodelphax striatellus]
MSAAAQMFLSPNFLPTFIDEYRNHQCLWRVKCKEYSNKTSKQKAYSHLVELCKTVIPDCNSEFVKKKIDLIRGNFRREHRKVIDSKRSGETVHVPKLWYYKLLLFLSDQEEVHQSITSVHSAENSQLTASNQADGDVFSDIDEHQEEELA